MKLRMLLSCAANRQREKEQAGGFLAAGPRPAVIDSRVTKLLGKGQFFL
jgi:hypothetical protein